MVGRLRGVEYRRLQEMGGRVGCPPGSHHIRWKRAALGERTGCRCRSARVARATSPRDRERTRPSSRPSPDTHELGKGSARGAEGKVRCLFPAPSRISSRVPGSCSTPWAGILEASGSAGLIATRRTLGANARAPRNLGLDHDRPRPGRLRAPSPPPASPTSHLSCSSSRSGTHWRPRRPLAATAI